MVVVVEVTDLAETRARARVAGKLFPRLFRKTRPPTGWQSETVRIRIRLALGASSASDDGHSAALVYKAAALNERITNRANRTTTGPLYLLALQPRIVPKYSRVLDAFVNLAHHLQSTITNSRT